MKQSNLSTVLSELNSDQLKAVKATSGPNLIIAGAGTGKTEVITKSITYLVESGKAKPEEILALTFTEKAALECLERVDAMSSYIYPDFLITTFHSFGDRVLREHCLDLGLSSEYRVLSEAEQLLFLRDNVFKLNLDYYMPKSDPTSFLSDLARFFSRAKDELITNEKLVAHAKKMKLKAKTVEEKEEATKITELADAYSSYNALLLEAGYVDYGDLIFLPWQLFKTHPSILAKWQSKLKYFLIDEFQDTNYGQYELVKLLASKSKNIKVVADDDQAIYRFRGAASYNVLTLIKDYPKTTKTSLITNYRSTQSILDHAYRLVQNNNPNRLEEQIGVSKRLKSTTGEGTPPELMLFETEGAEAEGIAEKIKDLVKKGKHYEEIAILVRANKHADSIVRALSQHKIPYTFSGAAGLYKKMEVKLCIAFFETIADPHNSLSLYHLLTSEIYSMAAEDLSAILHEAKYKNKSLLSAMKEIDAYAKISDELNFYRELSKSQTAGQLLNTFLNKSGYLKKLVEAEDTGDISAAEKIISLSTFFDRIVDFQRRYSDHSLQKFVEFIRLMLEVGEDPRAYELSASVEAVKILTVHKAKGLEFDTVFVASLTDGHFPTKARGGDRIPLPDELVAESTTTDEHYMEERRLFYVALTRAKTNLYLSAALDYGTKRTHKISRFVMETLPDVVISENFTRTSAVEKLRHFEVTDEPQKINYEPTPKGEKIVVSRAKIDDYKTCPLKYKFLHVMPIKVAPDQAVAYGNTIHGVIEEYFTRRLADRKVTLKELLDLYEEKWTNQGFLSATHEELRFNKGKEAVSNFYTRYKTRTLPVSVEEKFKFGMGEAVVEGRIDLIEKIDGKVRIVDIKTSDTVTDQDKADKRTKQSSQLKIYAYAYQKTNGKLPDEVSLYFVDTGFEGTYTPTQKDMDEIESVMLDSIAGIRSANYNATPSLMTCSYCPFRFYCNYAILDKVSG